MPQRFNRPTVPLPAVLVYCFAALVCGCEQLADRMTPVQCGQSSYWAAVIAGPDADWGCPAGPSESPSPDPQGLSGDGGRCPLASGDDACIACVKASCCEVSLACFDDTSCLTVGGAAYEAAHACFTSNCAKDCPDLAVGCQGIGCPQ
jgi:hypothetical protein